MATDKSLQETVEEETLSPCVISSFCINRWQKIELWVFIVTVWVSKKARWQKLCVFEMGSVHRGIQNSVEAILACQPALSTE